MTSYRIPAIASPSRKSKSASTAGRSAAVVGVLLMGSGSQGLRAQTVSIPNASFESPSTPFVSIDIDSWQKPAKPGYFDEAAFGFAWTQTAGLFQNTPVGASDHIDNLDGTQSAYLLAFPQVALFQDLSSPTAKFTAGMSYELTVGLFGKSMPAGDILTLSLYYRDGLNNMVTVGSTTVVYPAGTVPSTTHMEDFKVSVPTVQAGDAWAGQNIGVKLESTFGTGAGYWDVDKVRVTSSTVPEPGAWALGALGLGGLFLMGRGLRPRP